MRLRGARPQIPNCKPLPRGIHVQNIPHGPVYLAGFAGYTTLGITKIKDVGSVSPGSMDTGHRYDGAVKLDRQKVRMQKKFLGLVFIISGVVMMVGAVAAQIAWLGLCFGTLIIGVLMLFFAPFLLFAPFTLLFGTGTALWGSGLAMISDV